MKHWLGIHTALLGGACAFITCAHADSLTNWVQQMPLASVQSGTETFDAVLSLGTAGLTELANMIQPPDVGGDAQARYMISGLSFYVTRPGADDERALLETVWLAALNASIIPDTQAFFIRHLQLCGGPASRDVLAGYLADPLLCGPAARALLTLAAPGTGDAFLNALKAGEGDPLTLVQSLGILQHGPAAKDIRELSASEDTALQTAALDALANIGPVKNGRRWDTDSYAVLTEACGITNSFALSQALARSLRYARRAAELGASQHVLKAARSELALSPEQISPAIQAHALVTLIELDSEAGLAATVAAINSDNRPLSLAGVQLLTRLGERGQDPLVGILQDSAPHVRAAAMDVLKPGVSAPVMEAVLQATGDTNGTVRASAVSAAARLADRDALTAILSALDQPEPAVVAAVKQALLTVATPADMPELAQAMKSVAPNARVMLLNVLGIRKATGQMAAVLEATADEDENVRKAALDQLGAVVTPSEFPTLLSIYLKLEDAGLKRAAGRALVSVIREAGDAAPLHAGLQDAYARGDINARLAIVEVLAGIAGTPVLELVIAATKDADADVRNAALRVLANWPDHAAAPAMLAALQASTELAPQVLLVRGLTRVVPAGTQTDEAKLALYKDALSAAPRNEEKNMILGVMAQIRCRAALDLAAGALNQPELQASAALVVARSACPDKNYAGITDTGLRPVLATALAALKDETLATGLKTLLATMDPPAVPLEDGFTSIFNGSDLAGWVGDTNGYVVQDGSIVCKPGGNIYTDKEYSDFVLRFDFQLTPGANNGLGIRTPTTGNAAYVGMELQILDNTAEKYADLKPWQFHGSIYGLVPAQLGHLKPVGEWNEQEVIAQGSKIKVILNGTTIVDTDLATLEARDDIDAFDKHPGMYNTKGHIGFLGHGSVVTFRNLRIQELNTTRAVSLPDGFTPLFNGKDLTGWWGLGTEHYNTYRTLSPEDLEARKETSRADIQKHWRVENDELVNDGNGLYLTTDAFYGDFEFMVEYKTVPRADSGIYLRGCPQVQIWDSTEEGKFKLGADKGSGGLWNNADGDPGKNPLVLADKPFGEWNAFRIKMVGDKVMVHLNDKLVVDNATLHNYFDRTNSVPDTGPIQLQTHGGEIRWRNVFIREL